MTDRPYALARAITVSISFRGVSETSVGLAEALIELDDDAARHSFENGRRMVLNPMPAICARPSSRGIVHRPCGAQFDVSMPNHDTALIVYGVPAEVTMVEPFVDNHPGSAAAEAAGAARAPAATSAAPAAIAAARRIDERMVDQRSRFSGMGTPASIVSAAARISRGILKGGGFRFVSACEMSRSSLIWQFDR